MPTLHQSSQRLFILLFVFVAASASSGQDISAPQNPPSASGVISGAYFNPLQVGLLSWYGAGQPASFAVGGEALATAFDGANVWVTNSSENTVTRVRASDGAGLGTFAVGSE